MEAGHYEEAIKVLDKAVERWPSSALPYYYRGMSHVQLENDDQAVDDLTKFVEVSPSESLQVRQANDVLAKLRAAAVSRRSKASMSGRSQRAVGSGFFFWSTRWRPPSLRLSRSPSVSRKAH